MVLELLTNIFFYVLEDATPAEIAAADPEKDKSKQLWNIIFISMY